MIDINKGFNTQLNDYKQNIINVTNESGLPVGIVYYIMKDIFNEIEMAYNNALQKEKIANIQSTEIEN